MQDWAINDFSGGYMTNAAYHGGRQKSAQFLLNCRSDEQGWLIPRKGYTRVSGITGVSDIYIHKDVMLAVVEGILKWARVGEPTAELVFRDFLGPPTAPGVRPSVQFRVKNSSERVFFHAHEGVVFIGTGKASFVVEIPDPPNVPVVQAFYLANTPAFTVETLTSTKAEATKEVYLKFQAVYIKEEQAELPVTQSFDVPIPELAPRVVLAPASDAIRIEVATASGPA